MLEYANIFGGHHENINSSMSGHRNAAFDNENIILWKWELVQALYVNPVQPTSRSAC